MKRKTKIIVAVMGAVSLAGITVAALALLYVWSIFGLPGWRVRHADYPAVLRGCREMMLHRNSYSGRREDASREGEVFLEFAGLGMDPKLPKAIRALHPQFAIIRSNNVFLAVTGGFSHLAFEAYADGAKPDGGEYPGHKKLIDDLWLIYD